MVVQNLLLNVSLAQLDSLHSNENLSVGGCLEFPAKYPGGQKALTKFLKANIQYPDYCYQQGISEKITIVYAVDTFGCAADVKVCEGKSPYLIKEAIRVTSLLKGWRPATRDGKKIIWFQRQEYIFCNTKVQK